MLLLSKCPARSPGDLEFMTPRSPTRLPPSGGAVLCPYETVCPCSINQPTTIQRFLTVNHTRAVELGSVRDPLQPAALLEASKRRSWIKRLPKFVKKSNAMIVTLYALWLIPFVVSQDSLLSLVVGQPQRSWSVCKRKTQHLLPPRNRFRSSQWRTRSIRNENTLQTTGVWFSKTVITPGGDSWFMFLLCHFQVGSGVMIPGASVDGYLVFPRDL